LQPSVQLEPFANIAPSSAVSRELEITIEPHDDVVVTLELVAAKSIAPELKASLAVEKKESWPADARYDYCAFGSVER